MSSGSWLVPIAACCGGGGGAEELADLGPGEFLVAGVVDGLGQELVGLSDEAGQGVQPDRGVAEPLGRAEPGELADRLVQDLQAVLAGGGGGQTARMLERVKAGESVEISEYGRPVARIMPAGSTTWVPLLDRLIAQGRATPIQPRADSAHSAARRSG